MSELRVTGRQLARYGAQLAAAVALAPFAYLALFSIGGLFVRYPPLTSNLESAPELRGAFHLHSTASDGRRTTEEIARAAKAAGLQFIVMTDHNLRAIPGPVFEHGVLVISGTELSTRYGHLVAVGASRGLDRPDRDVDPVRHSQQLSALTVLAHPVQRRHPWTDAKSAVRAAGMELYSADSLFRDAFDSPLELLLPAAGAYLTNPMHALMILDRAQPKATSKLLELSARDPKLALCAHDAHGWPSYELMFRSFSLHVPLVGPLRGGLPADATDAAAAILEALAAAEFYCAFDALGAASGFAIVSAEGRPPRRARQGDRLSVHLSPHPPAPLEVRVWGGARVESDGRTVVLEQPGPVQVEVWIAAPGRLFGTAWKPWIAASPILVSSSGAERKASSGEPLLPTGTNGARDAR